MKALTTLGAMILFPLIAMFVCMAGCAQAEQDLKTFADNPNTVIAVGTLIDQAGEALQQAIDQAESAAIHVLAAEPNGSIVKKDIAQALRDVKAELDKVSLPVQTAQGA